jgi:DNA-binding response OmpR family regulator
MDLRRQVLIIEDDEDIALSLKYNLEKEGGFSVETASDGESGLRAAAHRRPDLVILDLNLPGTDGLSVCRTLRRQPATSAVPIMMLTARVEETDKIVGLELGADDYVTKPFSMREMLARTRAVLRRFERGTGDAPAYTDDLIHLDVAARVIKVAGKPVSLTRKEFDLLAALIGSRGRVLSRDQLLERVWGQAYYGETRTVDVHVRRLRQKLGTAAEPRIETVIGIGYRYRSPDPE